MPTSNACWRSCSKTLADRAITGVGAWPCWACQARHCVVTVKPSMSGMCKSSSTTSKAWALSNANAAWPPLASVTWWPSRASTSCSNSRFSGTSSTARMRSGGSATLATMGVAATGWPGGRGRQTVKQVPWFGMLLTCKRPCINSTSWRAMVVPSPVPPKRRVVLASACAKGVNTRLNCSAVMPMPVSCTCTCSHCSGPWRTCNVTLPVAVNLMALESRLSSTW